MAVSRMAIDRYISFLELEHARYLSQILVAVVTEARVKLSNRLLDAGISRNLANPKRLYTFAHAEDNALHIRLEYQIVD